MNQTRPLSYKRAICYSGFRDNQSPDTGVFPSESEILEDLLLLSGHWSALRVYACDVHTERVLRTIERESLPFKVMLGAYIGAEVNNPNCPWGGVYDDATLATNKEANRAELDRAIAESAAHGVVKVLTVPGKDTVLGATIVGEGAGELITEFVTAMKQGIGLNKMLGTIHAYPTLSEANKFAAGEWKKAHAPEWVFPCLTRFHAWRR